MRGLPISYRPYRLSDLEDAHQLDCACFEPVYRFSLGALRRFLGAKRARTTVAEFQGRMVGLCLGHIEPAGRSAVGYVVTLDVDPAVRRHGVGKQLLELFERQAREEGCRELRLHVSVGNIAATEFYEHCGWLRVHTAAEFYGRGLDAFVYRKPVGVSAAS